MLKIIIFIAVLAAFIWHFYIRDVSSLGLSQDKITISLNKKSTFIKVQLIEEKNLIFQTLYVKQKILERENGSLLVLEESRTDEGYQYNFPTSKSVQMILDAKEIKILLQANSLYFAQAVMRNREILNVIFRQSDDQSLILLYGLGNTELLGIIEALKSSVSPLVSDVMHDVLMMDNQEYAIKTRWSTRLHAIDGLITPSDYK